MRVGYVERRAENLAAITAHWPEDDLARLGDLVHRLADDLDQHVSAAPSRAIPDPPLTLPL